MPVWAREMVVQPTDLQYAIAPVVFSALPADVARDVEAQYATAGCLVSSNASAYRRDEDVPLLLPEVNPQHVQLIPVQRRLRGWPGAIVTNPNCASTGLTVALKAIQKRFGLRRAFVTTLQAASGAGYPGVAALDLLDNVIPFIGGEEEKLEWEPRKMLGSLEGEQVRLADLRVSAQVNRVAVVDGHMACVALELETAANLEEITSALRYYPIPFGVRDLPSTPPRVIEVRDELDRPQPRLDRECGGGMTTVIGRVRVDTLLNVKFVVLSHNTVRGAAGGAIYNAELMLAEGMLA